MLGSGGRSNEIRVAGTGALLKAWELSVGASDGNDNELCVENGGAVVVNGAKAFALGIGGIGGAGNRNRVVVGPDGVFSNANAATAYIGGNYNNYGGGFENEFIINGGKAWHGGEVVLGGSAYLDWGIGADSNVLCVTAGGELYCAGELNIGLCGASNRVEILEGGKVTVGNSLNVGLQANFRPWLVTAGKEGFGNVLRIVDGTLNLVRPGLPNVRGLVVTSGARLEIVGGRSRIRNDLGVFLFDKAVLRFEFDRVLPKHPLIEAKRHPAGFRCFRTTAGTTVQLELDVKELAMAGGGRVTLIELIGIDEFGLEELEDLITGATWENGIVGKLVIEKTSAESTGHNGDTIVDALLVCHVPNLSGTMILLR